MDQIRCLWIGRDLPTPATTGEKLYSLKLAESLALAGAHVTYLAQSDTKIQLEARTRTTGAQCSLTFEMVTARRRSYGRAIFSTLPLVAATYDTSAARAALIRLLKLDWDAIIFDNYATVWALAIVKKVTTEANHEPIIVYVSHNCERCLAHSLFKGYSGSIPRKLFLGFNYLKIKVWEKKLVVQADVLTSITQEDQAALKGSHSNCKAELVLTPGYETQRVEMPPLSGGENRRVVLVGSFKWVVKQQNLRELIHAADARFYENGISLDVVGEVPTEIIEAFEGKLMATKFHGFVKDFHPVFLRSRIAIVPEVMGGGFKLKILDYIFGGLPVATLKEAAAGLPDAVKSTFIQADSLSALIDAVILNIDQVEKLKMIQSAALSAAANEFNWADRGQLLYRAISASTE